jgi:hypothetical protein
VHAGGEGMNVIVRRDGGEFHVLGGGAGNETTHYEFERECKIDPGYHVYQVCFSHCLCHLACTICRLFYGPEALYDVYDVYCTGLACELSMAHGVIRRCRIRTSPLVKAHAIKIICMTIAEKFMYPIKFGGGRRRHKFAS